jgi:hypothetical protein
MKKLLTLILFATTVAAGAQRNFNYQNDFKTILAKTKDTNDSFAYDKLLKRFAENDTTMTNMEVLALLIGYTAKPEYKPYQDLDTERAIYSLNDAKKYKNALRLSNDFLQTHPLSIKALFEKSYSFHKLGKEDSAQYYLYRSSRIFQAMYFSGDGKTPETPTFALGPADGQDYIYKFVGADIGSMGSGSDKQGNFLDILEVKFENGQRYSLYFIIQHATTSMLPDEDRKKK